MIDHPTGPRTNSRRPAGDRVQPDILAPQQHGGADHDAANDDQHQHRERAQVDILNVDEEQRDREDPGSLLQRRDRRRTSHKRSFDRVQSSPSHTCCSSESNETFSLSLFKHFFSISKKSHFSLKERCVLVMTSHYFRNVLLQHQSS